MPKVLYCGLGGGLDVVNAALFYFAAKEQGIDARLGSSKTAGIDALTNAQAFSESGALIFPGTNITWSGRGRYIEPKISELVQEPVFYFGHLRNGELSIPFLRKSFEDARTLFGIDYFVFVDGGGDSLVLQPSDACAESEHVDPFLGGDAESLQALYEFPQAYLATIAVGLDISIPAFHNNKNMLRLQGSYYGSVDAKTGAQEQYALFDKIGAPFVTSKYRNLAEAVLKLAEEDTGKCLSHTAVVTYHALLGNYGLRRTFVPWEPTVDGKKGVIITPEQAKTYFFDVGKIHSLKCRLAHLS